MKNFLDLLRLMRPHQWIKNTFVFIGLLFGHAWHDPLLVSKVVLAFAAFCLVSSAVYILNDIVDIETKSEGEGLYKQVRVTFRGHR